MHVCTNSTCWPNFQFSKWRTVWCIFNSQVANWLQADSTPVTEIKAAHSQNSSFTLLSDEDGVKLRVGDLWPSPYPTDWHFCEAVWNEELSYVNSWINGKVYCTDTGLPECILLIECSKYRKTIKNINILVTCRLHVSMQAILMFWNLCHAHKTALKFMKCCEDLHYANKLAWQFVCVMLVQFSMAIPCWIALISTFCPRPAILLQPSIAVYKTNLLLPLKLSL